MIERGIEKSKCSKVRNSISRIYLLESIGTLYTKMDNVNPMKTALRIQTVVNSTNVLALRLIHTKCVGRMWVRQMVVLAQR